MSKLHPRTMHVQQAEAQLHERVLDWAMRWDLTSLEELSCLHAVAQRVTKYALRAERHPDDPDQPADLELTTPKDSEA